MNFSTTSSSMLANVGVKYASVISRSIFGFPGSDVPAEVSFAFGVPVAAGFGWVALAVAAGFDGFTTPVPSFSLQPAIPIIRIKSNAITIAFFILGDRW